MLPSPVQSLDKSCGIVLVADLLDSSTNLAPEIWPPLLYSDSPFAQLYILSLMGKSRETRAQINSAGDPIMR